MLTPWQVAVVACEDFPSVLQAVSLAQQRLCEIVSAIEFVDRASMHLVRLPAPRVDLLHDNGRFRTITGGFHCTITGGFHPA